KSAKALPGVPSASPAPASWTDIPSHNPFSFDRTDIPILEPKAPPAPPAPKIALGPKPVLFGTMSLGKEIIAMIGPGKPGNRDYKRRRGGKIIAAGVVLRISKKPAVVKGIDVKKTFGINDPPPRFPRAHSRPFELAPPPAATAAGASPPVPAVSPQPQPG